MCGDVGEPVNRRSDTSSTKILSQNAGRKAISKTIQEGADTKGTTELREC